MNKISISPPKKWETIFQLVIGDYFLWKSILQQIKCGQTLVATNSLSINSTSRSLTKLVGKETLLDMTKSSQKIGIACHKLTKKLV